MHKLRYRSWNNKALRMRPWLSRIPTIANEVINGNHTWKLLDAMQCVTNWYRLSHESTARRRRHSILIQLTKPIHNAAFMWLSQLHVRFDLLILATRLSTNDSESTLERGAENEGWLGLGAFWGGCGCSTRSRILARVFPYRHVHAAVFRLDRSMPLAMSLLWTSIPVRCG